MPRHIHSKVTSTQNKGASFFSCLGHGVQLEAAIQRCSVKKVFLEISQNSQENTCARVSFFHKVAGLRPKACIFIKKRLWHRYFHVNFAKFLRTSLVAASVQYHTSCLSKVKSFSDNSNRTFNVCMKTVNKFCVSNGDKCY